MASILIALACTSLPVSAALITPFLESAQNFAVLEGQTVTNTDATSIFEDLGVWPGPQITGSATRNNNLVSNDCDGFDDGSSRSDFSSAGFSGDITQPGAVPVPAALWLFGS